jgi:hypothetical protein
MRTKTAEKERKKAKTPKRMSTVAMPVAHAASLMIESFSAIAFGMSPAKPTRISG